MALATLTPGTVFARDYLVGALLAEGGMGAVYRAEQRSTGNTVALKVMLPELLADPKSRERFEQEARVSGRIKSSHVVKVFGAGIDESTQTPWLAMEFLEGESLAAFARARGPLAPGVALAVLQQVGHALSAAHAAGVVHCDLKPENVFVAGSQSVGVPFDVKVLDFGIARIVKEGRHSVTVTTAVGSPHWLAPEQGATGRTVGAPTDVWPFGLLAFWLLTGRFYWLNANVPDDQYNMYALLGEIAGRDPIAPASERLRALGEARALLPAGFDGWFARCVDRDVGRRFASAREAVEGLSAVLQAPAGAAGGATVVAALPSAPSGPTREMTVGVVGLAPPGHPMAGGTQLIGERARPTATAPLRRRGVVVAAVAAAAVAIGVAVGVVNGGPSTPARRDGPVAPATVVPAPVPAPAPAPPPAPTCPESMALVPAGAFMMGSPDGQGDSDERPQQRVQMDAFCMDRTEVTVAAYRACVGAGDCTPPDAHDRDNSCNGGRTDRDNHPANCIDWSQAAAFCRSRGARLPTEAQWEYAARGTDGRTYPWGNEPPTSIHLNASGDESHRAHRDWAAMAHFGDDGWVETAPVGSYPAGASPFGVLDMAGNVWEWTADWYSVQAGPADGAVGATSRVSRGGGWAIAAPDMFRTAHRNQSAPSDRDGNLGFRCAQGTLLPSSRGSE